MFLELLDSVELNHIQITNIIQILLEQFYLTSLILIKVNTSI